MISHLTVHVARRFVPAVATTILMISATAVPVPATEVNKPEIVVQAEPAVVRYYDPGVPSAQPPPPTRQRSYRPRGMTPRTFEPSESPRYRQQYWERYALRDRWQPERRARPLWSRAYPYGWRAPYDAAGGPRGRFSYGYAPRRYEGFASRRRGPSDGRYFNGNDWRREWQPAPRPYSYSDWRNARRYY